MSNIEIDFAITKNPREKRRKEILNNEQKSQVGQRSGGFFFILRGKIMNIEGINNYSGE